MKIEVASSKNQKRQRQQKVNIVSKVPVERVKSESRIEREGVRGNAGKGVLHTASSMSKKWAATV